MRKWAVILFMCCGLLVMEAKASHIVGGEFELVHISGSKYTLRMNLYFDLQNGDPLAQDPSVMAAIYRKSDNAYMTSFSIPLNSISKVDYFQPSCSKGEVETNKIIYAREIELPANEYNDPEGYYIAWERCCRNYNITNVSSSDPAIGVYAGQTFYLEFPAVVQNNEPFINSSPILFPPLNDYACPFRPYWVDFKGTDPDGDSLVYSIVTPLNTHSGNPSVPFIGANPGPYPDVQWETGFSLKNIMKGTPDLQISTDGFLTVTPTFQGLFVFAVKVDEYRDGKKIGEVRRDFQLLVVDKCPEAEAPVIRGKKAGEAGFPYKDNMSVTFAHSTPDEERCIEVQITDPDASKIIDNYSENVYIKAIPLGFNEDVQHLLPEDINATLLNGSDASFQICFDECPYFENGYFNIGIVAFDDACALPLTDTLRINVYVQPPPNAPAYFVDGAVLNLNVNEEAGGLLSRNIPARDNDNDSLTITITPIGFNPSDFGITLNPGNNTPGEVEALLDWNYDCQQYSFDGRTDFPFMLTVDDKDLCQFADPATMNLNLHINLPPNTEPDVNISVNNDDNYHFITNPINNRITFNVTATDADNDPIILSGKGVNFNFSNYPVTFSEKEGNGNPGLESSFSWEIPCDHNLAVQDSFRLHFYTEDFDKCQITNQDTIVVDVKLLPLESQKPVVNAFALNETVLKNNLSVTLSVGETASLRMVGADSDPDNVTLSLLNPEDFSTVDFPPITNLGSVSSNFFWTPECDILAGRDSVMVSGLFSVTDDNCYLPKGDTLEVNFIIHDLDNHAERFRPPNIITPNGDAYNEYFVLEQIFDENGENRSMPEDNCAGQFKRIEIFNRWGKNVFTSENRDFKWSPDNEPTGVYFYYLEYTNKTYKGTLSIFF